MQIDKILQSQGFGTRRECRSLIRHERVTVNGTLCIDIEADFDPAGLQFTIDDNPWTAHIQAYLMLHKPAGVECSRQPRHHPSVFSLLPPPLRVRGVQSVGRLDADTTGLLLFTDDGQFTHALSSPKRKVPKVYEVTTRHPVDEAQIAALLAGVVLHDDPAPVAATACEQLGETQLRLTVTGGKYHQVKRMIAATGNRVEALRRTTIGGLSLPADLAPGEWRWLDKQDLARLPYTQ